MGYCIIVHLIPISLVCLNALSMYSFSLVLVLFGKVKKRCKHQVLSSDILYY